jgi:NTE family protein
MKEMKVGLALGGGGARGLAHIGVVDILHQEGIPIDMIAGTSIGALVGAVYAQGKDCGVVKDVATSINLTKMMSLADLALPKTGFIGGKGIIKLLKTVIGGDVKFEDLEIPLALVATDIMSGEEVVIKKGSVLEGIRASISLPGIFTVVKWNNRYLVDGGLVNPVPVSVLKEMGADFIIAVNAIPDIGERSNKMLKRKKQRSKAPNIFNVLLQSLYIGTYQLAKSSLEGADIAISPNVVHLNPADFHRAKEFITQGELAAKAAIPDMKRKLSQAQGYDTMTT